MPGSKDTDCLPDINSAVVSLRQSITDSTCDKESCDKLLEKTDKILQVLQESEAAATMQQKVLEADNDRLIQKQDLEKDNVALASNDICPNVEDVLVKSDVEETNEGENCGNLERFTEKVKNNGQVLNAQHEGDDKNKYDKNVLEIPGTLELNASDTRPDKEEEMMELKADYHIDSDTDVEEDISNSTENER